MLNPLDPFDPTTQANSGHQQPVVKSPEQAAKLINLILFAMINPLIIAGFLLISGNALKGLIKPVFEVNPLIAALGLTGLLLSQILPPILRSVPPEQRVTDEQLYQKYQISMIVKYAIFEGCAFAILVINPQQNLFGLLVFALLVVSLGMSYVLPRHIREYMRVIEENKEFIDP